MSLSDALRSVSPDLESHGVSHWLPYEEVDQTQFPDLLIRRKKLQKCFSTLPFKKHPDPSQRGSDELYIDLPADPTQIMAPPCWDWEKHFTCFVVGLELPKDTSSSAKVHFVQSVPLSRWILHLLSNSVSCAESCVESC